jgi:uncharacterized protein (TIRG00374 family)
MNSVARFLVSIGLLALVVAFADWRAIWDVLRGVDMRWVGCTLALAACDRLATNHRWQILLAAQRVVAGFMRLLRVQLAANFLGSFLPSSLGVDAVRMTALCRAGEPAAEVIAATLVDRATMVLATLLLGAVTVLVLAHERVSEEIVQFVLVMTAIAVLATGICLLSSVRRWVRPKVLPYIPMRAREAVSRIAGASLAYRHKGRVMLGVGASTLVIFAIRILFAKALALSCGIDVPMVDLLLVIPILWIVVMLPITIGGIGVQDAGYVVLMAIVGVNAPVAVSMSLIEHVVSRAVSLPGVLFLGDVVSPPASNAASRAADT